MLTHFDTEGKAVFGEESRTPAEIAELKDVHDAIIEYGCHNSDIDFRSVDYLLTDEIFGLLDGDQTNVDSKILYHSGDIFCGR
jgi:hypothetical protein